MYSIMMSRGEGKERTRTETDRTDPGPGITGFHRGRHNSQSANSINTISAFHKQRRSFQLRPDHDGNVSMSAGRDIAKSEYVTYLYTVTTEVI